MRKPIYHKHHIIPRHAGGTNDPSNLVRLTVEEHAEAHRKLYEQYVRIGDKIAWQMLSGKTNDTESDFQELYRQAGQLSIGRKHSQETKDKIAASKIGRKRPDLAAYNRANKTGTSPQWSDETNRKRSQSRKEFMQTPEGIEFRRKQSVRMKENNPARRHKIPN